MKVAKITLLIWQDENTDSIVGDFETTIENDDFMNGIILSSELKDMGEWHDEHPMNYNMTKKDAENFFNELIDEKTKLAHDIVIKEKEIKELNESVYLRERKLNEMKRQMEKFEY